ncbi:MAG: ATP phosphoribosyltransferase regulatory subunit [Candidatus Carbobacillus altaicus]|uniref:ATP phosphoribosyltransferase regulatory subunit n=1 Tax=Candidatus Carbonibacillus altaicus TaxID=2163959 RepID=A0A2R6XZX2_9BACL|nr:MAG: ATP phosphoribosyltransferase regulatory subunit [Candidatus Carbobacillus altaicus]
MPEIFEKPRGFHDALPELARLYRTLETTWRTLYTRYGYEEVITPTLEYAETIGQLTAVKNGRLLKLFDADGHLLVFRPEMTTPIARLVSAELKHRRPPLRLMYTASVYRRQPEAPTHHAAWTQVGVERIGDADLSSDAEVLFLALESLKRVGVRDVHLVLSDARFLPELLDRVAPEPRVKEAVMQHLRARNLAEVRRWMATSPLPAPCREALIYLLHPLRIERSGERGRRSDGHISPEHTQSKQSLQAFIEALSACNGEASVQALHELSQLLEMLMPLVPESYTISLDLALIADQDYYTGLFFEGYILKSGVPVVRGGRYDALLAHFGRPLPATGFALDMERLAPSTSVELPALRPYRLTYKPDKFFEAVQEAERLQEQGYVVLLESEADPC